MNRNKLKIIFLVSILVQLFTAQVVLADTGTVQPVADQYSGPQSSIKQFLCTPSDAPTTQQSANGVSAAWTAAGTPGVGTAGTTNTAAGDLYTCINRIYKFAIILASVGAVLYIVIAGYMYMSSEGNSEMVDKAKSYVTSAITALVILFAGYILLRALNPDLIQFRNIQPPSVTPASSTAPSLNVQPGQAGTAGTVSSDVKTAATNIQNIIKQGRLSINTTSCDCAGNCPDNTLKSLAAGQQAQFDGPGSICAAGFTSVSANMLNALIVSSDAGNKFSIGSITGGHHSSASDPHYSGQAVDVTPTPPNSGTQQQLIASLQALGANVIALECSSGYYPISSTVLSTDTRCIGQLNYHIHAQWP